MTIHLFHTSTAISYTGSLATLIGSIWQLRNQDLSCHPLQRPSRFLSLTRVVSKYPLSSFYITNQVHSGARLDLPAEKFINPKIPGYDRLAVPSYSFLITHPSGQRLLFDLSLREDFENLAPPFGDICTNPESGWKVYSPRSVSDLLVENGILLEEINAIIWSHHHFDHTGNPSLFPGTTDLVVGPTFISRFAPGYPEKPDAPVRSSDWRGRSLREMDFDRHPGKVTIGRFKAIDWFGDGSFYLLHTPGHSPEHMCGLARVQPDSFILMGAVGLPSLLSINAFLYSETAKLTEHIARTVHTIPVNFDPPSRVLSRRSFNPPPCRLIRSTGQSVLVIYLPS